MAINIHTKGYAIVDRKDILLTPTVSPTRRGAIVNWLATDGGFLVGHTATDEDIEQVFQDHKDRHGGARVARVSISLVEFV